MKGNINVSGIDTLLIIYILANIIIGIPMCFGYALEQESLILMWHRFKNIEWHGKIVIILLNIIFAPAIIFVSIIYAIANVFREKEK